MNATLDRPPGADIEVVAMQAAASVMGDMPRYEKGPNPFTAVATGQGDCIARSLRVAQLTLESPQLETGILVVSCELAEAHHCMSSLRDPVTEAALVIDSKQYPRHERSKEVLSRLVIVDDDKRFQESVFGGMRTALQLLREPHEHNGEATREGAGEDEPDWSYWSVIRSRYTELTVTGFFGNRVSDLLRYFESGEKNPTAERFMSIFERYKRPK